MKKTVAATKVTVPMSETIMTPRLADKTRAIGLEGKWKVQYWPFKDDENKLVTPSVSDSKWQTKVQPGKIFYADPFGDNCRPANYDRVTGAHIDENDGAIMRRTAKIPANWKGKKIFLRFDAVYPAARYFLNGTCLGEHFNGVTPVEFDVTKLVKPGEEVLVAIRLIRRYKYLQMDMFRHALEFGGMSQGARFLAVDPCYISDYSLVTSLNKDLVSGSVKGTVVVSNTSSRAVTATVCAGIDKLGSFEKTEKLAAGETKKIKVAFNVKNPKLWNDESPNIYDLNLALDVKGQDTQKIEYKTAFRRLDLTPEGAFLNGNPVKFRGVNHLSFNPEGGLYQPKDWLRKCFELMKKANVNCIRAHMCAPEAVAELCDEMGIYFIQELTCDWGTHYIHLPDWMPPAHQRIEAAIRRDRHHPSIMLWNVGNENMPESAAVAEQGWKHMHEFEVLCHKLDPSRPTMFPPPGPANKIKGIFELRFGEVADTHYSFNDVKSFLKTGEVKMPYSWESMTDENGFTKMTREEALKRGWSGTWFSSEWGLFNGTLDQLHAPYASVIDDIKEDIKSTESTLDVFERRFNREWGLMRDSPSCLGGTYFPWLCAGVGEYTEGNPWGFVRWAESADWGVVTADLLPKPMFWALRIGYSPVYPFPSRLYWNEGETSIKFKLRNSYNSIDFKDCHLRVYRSTGSGWMHMMNNFLEVPLECAPGKNVDVEIPLTKGQLEGLEKGGFAFFRCIFTDPKGFSPIKADILVYNRTMQKELPAPFPVGPDAIMD